MAKKSKGRLVIKLNGVDKELEVTKLTELTLNDESKEYINFDKMKDGTWRLIYTGRTIPDIKALQSIELVRIKEDES